jgi:hypothetical protein
VLRPGSGHGGALCDLWCPEPSTGRDEVCDAAAEGLDPDDIRRSDEAMAHAELFERCSGDGRQPVEEFEKCAEEAGTGP